MEKRIGWIFTVFFFAFRGRISNLNIYHWIFSAGHFVYYLMKKINNYEFKLHTHIGLFQRDEKIRSGGGDLITMAQKTHFQN